MVRTLLGNSFVRWYRQALRHSKWRAAIILGTLFYLLSPVDIAPDVFPIIGWVDDGVVASIAIAEITQLLLDKRRTVKAASDQDSSPTVAHTIDVDAVSI